MKCSSTSTEHIDPKSSRLVKHRHGTAHWRKAGAINLFVYCDMCADAFTSIGHLMVRLDLEGTG